MTSLKRITVKDNCYFVTTNTHDGRPLFADPKLAEVVIQAIHFLRASDRMYVFGWVLMPDHLHLILMPRGEYTLPRIMHSIKSYSAQEINKALGWEGKVWQDNYYEHGIRNRQDLDARLRYTLENPVRAGSVENTEDYPYSSVHFEVDL